MKKLLVAFCLLFAPVLAANAASISYVFTGTGSGSLNGVSFSNKAFTITGFGDTTTAQACPSRPSDCKFVDHSSAFITLDGTTYSISTGTRTFYITGGGRWF